MTNEIWRQEEKKFFDAIKDVKIPNANLVNVDSIVLKKSDDCDKIPSEGGCYWIWTNEPVSHSLHKHLTPMPFEGGEIIYNGIAKDDVKGRIVHHLFGEVDAGWSGISMDIYFGNTKSHRKKALSDSGKVPFVKDCKLLARGNKKKGQVRGETIEILKPIKNKEDLLKLNLSEKEKKYIGRAELHNFFFRNGINITEEKHNSYEFRAYFITGLSSLYLDFIEKKWREENKWLPKLCSYSSGR